MRTWLGTSGTQMQREIPHFAEAFANAHPVNSGIRKTAEFGFQSTSDVCITNQTSLHPLNDHAFHIGLFFSFSDDEVESESDQFANSTSCWFTGLVDRSLKPSIPAKVATRSTQRKKLRQSLPPTRNNRRWILRMMLGLV